MTTATPATAETEERGPGYNRPMGLYAPFVWLAVMVIRMGLRAGCFFNPEFLMPSRPGITPHVMHRNRQLRRARKSCLARARRHILKGRRIRPENYTPKAYAHYAYVCMMDKTISPGQFMERYIRDNDLSRVQVYAMDSAHNIAGYVAGLGSLFSNQLTSVADVFSLSLAAPSDPAPP